MFKYFSLAANLSLSQAITVRQFRYFLEASAKIPGNQVNLSELPDGFCMAITNMDFLQEAFQEYKIEVPQPLKADIALVNGLSPAILQLLAQPEFRIQRAFSYIAEHLTDWQRESAFNCCFSFLKPEPGLGNLGPLFSEVFQGQVFHDREQVLAAQREFSEIRMITQRLFNHFGVMQAPVESGFLDQTGTANPDKLMRVLREENHTLPNIRKIQNFTMVLEAAQFKNILAFACVNPDKTIYVKTPRHVRKLKFDSSKKTMVLFDANFEALRLEFEWPIAQAELLAKLDSSIKYLKPRMGYQHIAIEVFETQPPGNGRVLDEKEGDGYIPPERQPPSEWSSQQRANLESAIRAGVIMPLQEDGCNYLCIAISTQDTQGLQFVLEHKDEFGNHSVEVNRICATYADQVFTPIQLAIEFGQPEIVAVILQREDLQLETGVFENSPIHQAILKGDEAIVKPMLLKLVSRGSFEFWISLRSYRDKDNKSMLDLASPSVKHLLTQALEGTLQSAPPRPR